MECNYLLRKLLIVGLVLLASGVALRYTSTPAGFVYRQGTALYLNGSVYKFTGMNLYQANQRSIAASGCSYSMGNNDTVLSDALTSMGGSGNLVMRAWFFQSFATVNGARDWAAFDHTLSVAAAHNIKVIATLGNQWGSCEAPSGYRDLGWYTAVSPATQPRYYTELEPVTSYYQWVHDFVARYASNSTIAMIQLMNESEAKDAGGSCSEAPAAQALASFTANISNLIHSLDPNHLISLGTMGGGQCGIAGSDYGLVSNNSDLCEFHDYNHITEAMPTHLSDDLSQCNAVNKPVYVGETGITCSAAGGSTTTRESYFAAKFTAQFGAGVVGEVPWDFYNAANGGSCASGGYAIGPGDPTLSLLTQH